MRRQQSGMTLLEVIVALAVAGAALAAGAAVLGFLTDQGSRTGAQSIASANAVRTTIREWTSGARLTTEGDAEFRGGVTATELTVFADDERRNDQLSFVTSTSTEIAPAGSRVRIHMNTGDSIHTRGLVAELTPWRRSGAPVVVSLAPDATGLRIRYLGSLFGTRVWQDNWVSTSVLPSAVELRILFDTSAFLSSADRAAHALLAEPITVPLAGRR